MTTFITGDQHACKCPFENWKKSGWPGMPVWDAELRPHLEAANEIGDRVIWSCSYPLMGVARYGEISTLSVAPPEYRKIHYGKGERGFFGKPQLWRNLSQERFEFLLAQWLEILQYYLEQFPQMELLPLSAFYFSWAVDRMPNAYGCLLNELADSCIDLTPLREMRPEWFSGGYGELTDQGWKQIFPEEFAGG